MEGIKLIAIYAPSMQNKKRSSRMIYA